VLKQAPYFPDFSHYDFHFSQKLKSGVKGYHFQTLDSVQMGVTDVIKTLTDVDFQSCYETWKILWAKCVLPEGCYFEWDDVDLGE
jgi:hypothetical protein